MRLLILEPYDGGSHRRFLDELVEQLGCEVLRLSLPARQWKWRMRLAAVDFAKRLHDGTATERRCDVILASSFLDLGLFKSLAPQEIAATPVLLYFHENQFVYPNRKPHERDVHFGLTNLTSALAADRCLFNSRFNFDSFIEGATALLRRASDLNLGDVGTAITKKSGVLPVPLDFEREPSDDSPRPPGPPWVLWNHRWEHDKNPELFLSALKVLDREGLAFRVALCGQKFDSSPSAFEDIKELLGDRVVHFGFVPKRSDYLEILRSSRVVVSTAEHEFQGLAILEAVAQGAFPVLPDRLSYPELFPDLKRYRSETEFIAMLREALLDDGPPQRDLVARSEEFSWSRLLPRYRAEFRSLIKG